MALPLFLEDGTLGLPCGSLWTAYEIADWRSDHLPGCALCEGNFGKGE